MKSIILYHGSDHVIEKPRYNFGKKDNDFCFLTTGCLMTRRKKDFSLSDQLQITGLS